MGLRLKMWLVICFLAISPCYSWAGPASLDFLSDTSSSAASSDPNASEISREPAKKQLTVLDFPVVQLTHRHQSTSLEIPKKQPDEYFARPVIDYQVLEAIRNDERLDESLLLTTHLLLTDNIAFASSVPRENLTQDVAYEFLRALDPSYVFFTKQEVLSLSSKKGEIEKAMKGEDLGWILDVFTLYQQKMKERVAEFKSHTPPPVSSFSVPLSWQDDPYLFQAFSEHQILSHMGPAGGDRKKAYQLWMDHFTKMTDNASQMTQKVLVQVFLRSYAQACDPHSLYLSPAQKNHFQQQVNKVVEGIGFSWKIVEDGRIVVQAITTESPASTSGLLALDEIISVILPEGEMVLLGKSQAEVAQVFSKVSEHTQFKIKRGAETSTIVINSARIALTSSLASEHFFIVNGKKVLSINIPSFYRDPQNPNRRGGSMTKDVYDIIKKAKENSIPPDLIVLDFRGNAGGILAEAASLLGLFMEKGISTQVRTANSKAQSLDIEPYVVWSGPLMAFVDHRSASASEIVVSSLQDYRRALVVGQQTYGKGSAQTLFDLDALAKLPTSVFGQVNLTTMMFHRPNGQAVQLHGITPDLVLLPSMSHTGERSFRHILENSENAPDLTKQVSQTTYNTTWYIHLNKGQEYLEQSLFKKEWYSLFVKTLEPPVSSVSLNASDRAYRAMRKASERQKLQALLEREQKEHSAYGKDVLLQYAIKSGLEVFYPRPS